VRELGRHEWRREPVVLHDPVHFVSLLKGVDGVVSSGGTMLREAAYLGVRAYSIFQSRIGAVDRYLESIGRLSFVATPADFGSIEVTRAARLPVLSQNPQLGDELLAEISSRLNRADGARTERR
jgi:predicted glycosyltransferase